MNRKATDSILTVIGIDIGKNAFHLVGLDERGAIVIRQKLGRRLAVIMHRSWVDGTEFRWTRDAVAT